MASLEKIVRVHKEAYALIAEHGLDKQGWTFTTSKTKRRIGDCSYQDKEIRVSEHFLDLSDWDDIVDVILHEIAHALIGPGYGHGYEWKQMARRIGANPDRVAESPVMDRKSAPYNYVMRCPNCGREWKRYRMRQRNFGSICPDCHVPVKIFRYVKK